LLAHDETYPEGRPRLAEHGDGAPQELVNVRETAAAACDRRTVQFVDVIAHDLQYRPHVFSQRAGYRLEYRQVQTRLAAEVIGDQGLVDPGCLGDAASAGGAKTVASEDFQARVEQGLACLRRARRGLDGCSQNRLLCSIFFN
jgi:hypothetical protein